MKTFYEFIEAIHWGNIGKSAPSMQDYEDKDRPDMRERPDLHDQHVSDFIKQSKDDILKTIYRHFLMIKESPHVEREEIESLIDNLENILRDPVHARYMAYQGVPKR